MNRITRDRRLTPEEAAKYNQIREQVAKEFPKATPEEVELRSHRWKWLELTQTGPRSYTFRCEDAEGVGEGELSLSDEPPPHWAELARYMQAEYKCVVRVMFPEGCDPRIVQFNYPPTATQQE